jgi:hypothetical protein
MRWAGYVARMEAMRNVYQILIGKSEGKRSFGRPRGRWEDDIRNDPREICWKVWTGYIWLRIGASGGLL